MSKNVDRGGPGSQQPRSGSSRGSSSLTARLRDLLKNDKARLPPVEPSDTSYCTEWLEHCIKQVQDAYTLEDAIDWHRETIEEISEHITTIRDRQWPEDLKRRTIFDLMHLRLEYRAGLTNLRGAQSTDEPIRWPP